MSPKTAAQKVSVTAPTEASFYISATPSATRPRLSLKHNDTFVVLDSHGDIGASEANRRAVPPRHAVSLAPRIAGQRRAAAAARLQFARRQRGAGRRSDQSRRYVRSAHRPGKRYACTSCARSSCGGTPPISASACAITATGRSIVRLSILFANDFADLFEVRGAHRARRGTATAKLRGNDQVLLSYHGLDGKLRRTTLTFDPPPDRLATNGAIYELRLAPGETRPIFLAAGCNEADAASGAVSARAHRGAPRAARGDARPHQRRNLERAVQRDAVPVGGRSRNADDGHAAGPLSLCRHPLVLDDVRPRRADHGVADAVVEPGRGARRAAPPRRLSGQDDRSARRCAAGKNPARDARRRNGGAARSAVRALLRQRRCDAAVRPAGRALSSNAPATSRPSPNCGRRSRRRWPGSTAPAIRTATASSNTSAPASKVSPIRAGKIRTTRSSTPTGDWPRARSRSPRCRAMSMPPNAWRRVARGGLAATTQRAKLDAEAARLAERFEAAFWCPQIETYALALDGAKKPCRVRTSNAGQVLFTGIADAGAGRAASPRDCCGRDFFSGWGIRTVARGEARYNPMSYHNGSIWPHDNALIALGLARYGLKAIGRNAVRGPVRRRAPIWTFGGCRNCSAASSASAATARRSIPSPARRRPGPARRRSRCWKLRSASNSIRSRTKSGCAIRGCRRFSTR